MLTKENEKRLRQIIRETEDRARAGSNQAVYDLEQKWGVDVDLIRGFDDGEARP